MLIRQFPEHCCITKVCWKMTKKYLIQINQLFQGSMIITQQNREQITQNNGSDTMVASDEGLMILKDIACNEHRLSNYYFTLHQFLVKRYYVTTNHNENDAQSTF